jgi:Flp pilus assembly protein protease CpaA
MDRRTWYIIAAVVVVILVLGYALGWFGGADAPTTPAPATGTTAPAPATGTTPP